MNILLLNTAGRETHIGVIKGEEEILRESAFFKHSENLFPMLEEVLNLAEMKVDDFDAFAVVVGPGSFTGIRIGIAVAKGLSYIFNKPVIEISTLELLAFTKFMRSKKSPICAIINAGAGLVYHQIFEFIEGDIKKTNKPKVDKLEHFLGYIHENYEGINLVYFDNYEKKSLPLDLNSEEYSIEALAKLTKQKFIKGEFTNSKNVMPLYLRASQAEAMVKNLEIVEATREDIPDILVLEAQNDEWDLNWSEIATRQSFDNPNFRCFLAKSGGEVKGMMSIMMLPDEAEILRVNVLNSARLNGVATSLFDWLKHHLREAGCKAIFLEVNSQNYPAISLYRKQGFTEISRREDYYADHQDAIIMRCEL